MDMETGTQSPTAETPAAPSAQGGGEAYRVLARKYRPQTFAELIGQEAMVRTLSNAIEKGRLAHAFILTGVRGIGKTTTARLIARALDCIGADGNGGPTVDPCGVCEHCVAIAESRHVDVMEMDAASRTGVDDIREIIEGVRYAPVSARYKIYIIDEVHMLSKNAFNALLKTLEEPPEHVKFIFATTEIRKVPVTVLSRCQRFDLKRVEADELVKHFSGIAKKESADIEDAALALIARAAEGSVRDGLSLLDQAIAHGAGTVTEEQARDMLGLADRAQVLDLFRAIMSGETKAALDILRSQYVYGADPVVILQDLLEVVHWLTRLKITPEAAGDSIASEAEAKLGAELARDLSMPVLTRSWQMILKGVQEARIAPSPIAAAEMVIVRLAYSADLPSPADLVKKLKHGGTIGGGHTAAPTPPAGGGNAAPSASSGPGVQATASGGPRAERAPEPAHYHAPEEARAPHASPRNFEELVALFEDNREMRLAIHLSDHVHLVSFAPGRIDIRPKAEAPPDLPHRVMGHLKDWTGERWIVTLSSERGEDSLREQEEARAEALRAEVEAHPLIRDIRQVFPDAKITDIRDIDALIPPETGADDEALDDDI
jgi:DNA polymerase-3 subunit gamma/tau